MVPHDAWRRQSLEQLYAYNMIEYDRAEIFPTRICWTKKFIVVLHSVMIQKLNGATHYFFYYCPILMKIGRWYL